MALLSSKPPVPFAPLTDPRCQADAYVRCGAHLYEVVCWDSKDAKLHVVNSLTEHPLWLTESEVQRATLIRAAPPIEIPADWQPAATGRDLPSENAD